jgi:hypothetical protein
MVERTENPPRKSADVKVDTGEKYQKDSNINIIGVLLPKEEKGTAGVLEVKHPQQNIREFSLCQVGYATAQYLIRTATCFTAFQNT